MIIFGCGKLQRLARGDALCGSGGQSCRLKFGQRRREKPIDPPKRSTSFRPRPAPTPGVMESASHCSLRVSAKSCRSDRHFGVHGNSRIRLGPDERRVTFAQVTVKDPGHSRQCWHVFSPRKHEKHGGLASFSSFLSFDFSLFSLDPFLFDSSCFSVPSVSPW